MICFEVLIILFIHFTIFFIIGLKKKNNGLIDIAWGLGFVLVTLYTFLNSQMDIKHIILLLMISLWGLRLSYHLFKRNWNKKEDFRYEQMRIKFRASNFAFFIHIYMAQLVLMFLIANPIILINLTSNPITIIDIFAIALWIFGFAFEVIGDFQLKEFLKLKTKGVMKTGLWKYTRHPNYFGEITMWWAIWLLSLNIYAILSPILITFLIVYVSGVPLLENKYKDNKEYQEYMKVTNKLIPGFRKKV